MKGILNILEAFGCLIFICYLIPADVALHLYESYPEGYMICGLFMFALAIIAGGLYLYKQLGQLIWYVKAFFMNEFGMSFDTEDVIKSIKAALIGFIPCILYLIYGFAYMFNNIELVNILNELLELIVDSVLGD